MHRHCKTFVACLFVHSSRSYKVHCIKKAYPLVLQ